jgi:uncharacterized damage-inducible protein DinB
VRNWKDYNQALIRRGSLTVWIEETTLQAWCQNMRDGQVGAPTTYSDLAIQALLTLKVVFSLPLRQTQGLAQSVLQLMASDLPIPTYSTLSRRADGLAVALPRRTKNEPLHVVIDSTGLKVYGEGEWKTRQHGVSKRRTWRKMHLGVDEATGEIVAVVTTERDVGDCEVLPQLLAAIGDEIAQVSADGAYDTIGCHQAIAARQARVAIPPRENAVITDIGQWDAREQAVRRIGEIGRPLTLAQLQAAAKISHETAFDLVRHMLDTEWSWRLFASGSAGQQYLWKVEDISNLPALQRFWSAERDRMLDYVHSLSEADLERAVEYGTAQGGKPQHAKVWQILLHVVNHSTHHRTELSRYLEDCGHPIDEQDLDFGSFVARINAQD